MVTAAPSGNRQVTWGDAAPGAEGDVIVVSGKDVKAQGTIAAANLPGSGVVAGTYGDATHSPQLTVDAYGRATAAANVAITGVPTASTLAAVLANGNDAGGVTISNLPTPNDDGDPATKSYVDDSIYAAQPLRGVATLALGTVTVANASVTANSLIFVSHVHNGGVVANLGLVYEDKTARVVGTSFKIKSSVGIDNDDVNWLLIEP